MQARSRGPGPAAQPYGELRVGAPQRRSLSERFESDSRNWETNGILTIQSGTPFTVLVQGDPLGENNTDPSVSPNLVMGGMRNPVNPQNANGYIKPQCFAAQSQQSTRKFRTERPHLVPGLIEMVLPVSRTFPSPRFRNRSRRNSGQRCSMSLIDPTSTSPNDIEVINGFFGSPDSQCRRLYADETTTRGKFSLA